MAFEYTKFLTCMPTSNKQNLYITSEKYVVTVTGKKASILVQESKRLEFKCNENILLVDFLKIP